MQDKTPRPLYVLVHGTERSSPTDYAALYAARSLAGPCKAHIHALLIVSGNTPEPAKLEARRAGAHAVTLMHLDAQSTTVQPQQLAELFVAMIRSAGTSSSSPPLILVSAGTAVEEAAGAIAAHIDALPLGRPASLSFDDDGALRITRSGFGGRLNLEQKIMAEACIAAVRAGDASSTEPKVDAQPSDDDISVQSVDPVAVPPPYPVTIGTQTENEANLDGARLIVSGGRGMAGDTGFALLRDLAKKLDGALGSSLPAVDAGWAPVSRQVGQSGKYVSPEIYIAVGISGTPQHLAGIDPHTQIIAINKDPDAAIFQVARVGVVAEWEEFLPALLEVVEAKSLALSV